MNKSLEFEIKLLSFMMPGTVKQISNECGEGYLCKGSGEYAIAIEYDFENPINEEFVGLNLSTNYLNFDSKTIKVLYLHTPDSVDLDKLSYIGAQFINKKNKNKILEDPYKWVDDWKDIFGDSKRKKRVYDVIGELLALKYIYEKDHSASWQGPAKGTHDITTKDILYEVKTTTVKNQSIVSINSAFQLSKDKKEKLILCRLEHKPFANSINSLIEELIELGYSREELESSVSELGYKKGSRYRNISYEVLNINSYDVNEKTFPLISLEQMNGFAPMKNILNYKIILDLSSIEYEIIK